MKESLGRKLVPEAGHRNDHRRLLGIAFQLLAQAADVNIHGSRERILVVAPDVLEQDLARKRRAAILYEVAQEAKLAGGKRHGRTVAKDGRTTKIYLDRPELLESRRFRRRAGTTAEQSFDARQQLQHFEGLGEVIISADLQSQHLVHQLAARRQHDDGHSQGGFADVTADVKAVLAGQHHVENDEVIRSAERSLKTFSTVRGAIRHIALAPQAVGEGHAQVFFVLDDQNTFVHEEQLCSLKDSTQPSGRR